MRNLWVPVSAITTNDQERAINAFWDGKEDRSDEVLGVVVLLEDFDLLTKTGAVAAVLAFVFFAGTSVSSFGMED